MCLLLFDLVARVSSDVPKKGPVRFSALLLFLVAFLAGFVLFVASERL
jgi:hypothetical protein